MACVRGHVDRGPSRSPALGAARPPAESPELDLLGGRWRCHVVIERPGRRLREVLGRESLYHHLLLSPLRARDRQPVTRLYGAMRLGALVVDGDLATSTRPLRLRTGLEQTRDIEPDIESGAVSRDVFEWHAGSDC